MSGEISHDNAARGKIDNRLKVFGRAAHTFGVLFISGDDCVFSGRGFLATKNEFTN